MSTESSTIPAVPSTPEPEQPRRRGSPLRRGEGRAGLLFISPAVMILLVFLILPVFAALWVSVSDWTGKGSPLDANFVGLEALRHTAAQAKGLAQTDLGTSLRNNLVLRDSRGPIADRARADAGAGGEPTAAARQGVLPHRVLLPVGHQLGGHLHRVPVPVQRQPAWSTPCSPGSGERAELVRRSTRRAAPAVRRAGR